MLTFWIYEQLKKIVTDLNNNKLHPQNAQEFILNNTLEINTLQKTQESNSTNPY